MPPPASIPCCRGRCRRLAWPTSRARCASTWAWSSAPRTTRIQTTASSSFPPRGQKLPDAWELEVEAALLEAPQWADSAGLGKARRIDDAVGRYVEFCKGTVRSDLTLKGMKLVVDAAHGAAYHVAPDVFHELGADVVKIGCSPDGTNINAGFGATSPAALVKAVAEERADYGIALDGDADRLQLVDASRPPVQW